MFRDTDIWEHIRNNASRRGLISGCSGQLPTWSIGSTCPEAAATMTVARKQTFAFPPNGDATASPPTAIISASERTCATVGHNQRSGRLIAPYAVYVKKTDTWAGATSPPKSEAFRQKSHGASRRAGSTPVERVSEIFTLLECEVASTGAPSL